LFFAQSAQINNTETVRSVCPFYLRSNSTDLYEI